MATSLLAFIEIAIALEIFVLLNMGKELIKTLKRIEARLVLTSPLEEERKVFEERLGYVVRTDIRDRAIHPDVWWHQYYDEIKDLKGKELKEAKGIWRSRERKRGS
jgi:hypothetical protein